MGKTERVVFSERERALIQSAADELGISFAEAAEHLAAKALERRFRKRTGRTPATQVRDFHKRSKT